MIKRAVILMVGVIALLFMIVFKRAGRLAYNFNK